MQAFRRCPGSQNEACFPTHWQASAGFEPAVEVLQIAICSSPEFAEVHCVLYGKPECSLEFILVRQSLTGVAVTVVVKTLVGGNH